jgi:hypothetical protein
VVVVVVVVVVVLVEVVEYISGPCRYPLKREQRETHPVVLLGANPQSFMHIPAKYTESTSPGAIRTNVAPSAPPTPASAGSRVAGTHFGPGECTEPSGKVATYTATELAIAISTIMPDVTASRGAVSAYARTVPSSASDAANPYTASEALPHGTVTTTSFSLSLSWPGVLIHIIPSLVPKSTAPVVQ